MTNNNKPSSIFGGSSGGSSFFGSSSNPSMFSNEGSSNKNSPFFNNIPPASVSNPRQEQSKEQEIQQAKPNENKNQTGRPPIFNPIADDFNKSEFEKPQTQKRANQQSNISFNIPKMSASSEASSPFASFTQNSEQSKMPEPSNKKEENISTNQPAKENQNKSTLSQSHNQFEKNALNFEPQKKRMQAPTQEEKGKSLFFSFGNPSQDQKKEKNDSIPKEQSFLFDKNKQKIDQPSELKQRRENTVRGNEITYKMDKLNASLNDLFFLLAKDRRQSKSDVLSRKGYIENLFNFYLPVFRGSKFDLNMVEENIDYKNFLKKFGVMIQKNFEIHLQKAKVMSFLFGKMLKELNLEKYFYSEKQFNKKGLFERGIYTGSEGREQLNQEEDTVLNLLRQFASYYFSQISLCVQKIYDWPELIKSTGLFGVLWENCLELDKIGSIQGSPKIRKVKMDIMKEKKKLSEKITKLLMHFFKQYDRSYSLVDENLVAKRIRDIDHLQSSDCIELCQKIILMIFSGNKKNKIGKQLIKNLDNTKSLGLLPLRMMLNNLGISKSMLKPYVSELYTYVQGDDWVEWISIHLTQQEHLFYPDQKEKMAKALQTITLSINQLQNRKLHKILGFVKGLKEENYSHFFYETLSLWMKDYSSIQQIEQYFFREGFKGEFQSLVEEVRKFPNSEFPEEYMKENVGKAKFLLKLLEVAPQKAFDLENTFFDVYGFMKQANLRCDRICQMIIDFISYFSGDNRIIQSCFSAITSLLKNEGTKSFMSFAMNINKPSLKNYRRNEMGLGTIKAINGFLTHIFKGKQFYELLKQREGNRMELAQIYLYRYNIEQYIEIYGKQVYHVPFFWIKESMNTLPAQEYNPEILELLLSKLKLKPSQMGAERPQLLQGIVKVINQVTFWEPLIECLKPIASYTSNSFQLVNQVLTRDASAENEKMFYSLRFVRTLLELHQILSSHENLSRHPFILLLSSLRCLHELGKYFFQEIESESMEEPIMSPILSILSLINVQSNSVNMTNLQPYTFHCISEGNIRMEKQLEELNINISAIDYDVVRNFFIPPQNYEIQCLENISSLAFQCLALIFESKPSLSLEAIMLGAMPQQSPDLQVLYKNFQERITDAIVKGLGTQPTTIARPTWKFLLSLGRDKKNKGMSQQLFSLYRVRNRRFQLDPTILCLVGEFLQLENEELVQPSLVDDLIGAVSQFPLGEITGEVKSLKGKSFPNLSYHQLERYMHERKVTSLAKVSWALGDLIKIVVEGLLSRKTGLKDNIAHLINLVAKNKIPTFQIQPIPPICQEAFHKDGKLHPRDCGTNTLQRHLYTDCTIETLMQGQVENVVNWCYMSMDSLQKRCLNFLSLLLSIDETFYSNHAIKMQSRIRSSIFIHMHLGVVQYQALDLMGKSRHEAVKNVLWLVDGCLGCIEDEKFTGQSSAKREMLKVIDQCLCWLNEKKGMQGFETVRLCKRTLSNVYPYLGEPLYDSVAIKLLLTIVNIAHQELGADAGWNIRETVLRTLQSQARIAGEEKQQLISVLVLIPPMEVEKELMSSIVDLWVNESNECFFYNESRVIIRLCERHPVEMAKFRLFYRCEKLKKFGGDGKFPLYSGALRSPDGLSWIWILKICSTMLENSQSVIVMNQVTWFITQYRQKLLRTLKQFKPITSEMDEHISVNYAQLCELEATLQLMAVVMRSQVWVQIQRHIFQQFLYTLFHHTLPFFTASDSKLGFCKKSYAPLSENEKILWKIKSGVDERMNDERLNEMFSEEQILQPNVMLVGMHYKFQNCLQLWALAISIGLRSTWMVQVYFNQPIPETKFKYSIVFWDHVNKVILGILNMELERLKEWKSWAQKKDLLQLVHECFICGEMFTEQGYLGSMNWMPSTGDDLLGELSNCLYLLLEMGLLHLITQQRFRNKFGQIMKGQLQKFRDNLLKQASRALEQVTSWDAELYEHQAPLNQIISQIKSLQI